MWQFLIFLAAAAGARIVAADARLVLRIGSIFSLRLAGFDGRLLLRGRSRCAGRGFVVDRLAFLPRRADEILRPTAPCGRSNRSRARRRCSTSARRSASPRVCIRPWDRPGRSRAGRRWSANGPSPADDLSRPCREFAAPASAPSAAFRGGSDLRPPSSAGLQFVADSRASSSARARTVERRLRSQSASEPNAPLPAIDVPPWHFAWRRCRLGAANLRRFVDAAVQLRPAPRSARS